MKKKIRVIVGISGGVDSAIAAYCLLKQDYHVEGIFMKNWEEDGNEHKCDANQDLIDAQSVCSKLGIRLHTVNFSTTYWDNVFQYFLDEHIAGRTPNPDVLCNKEIKFKAFLEYAKELGAEYIATGHYVRKDKIDEIYLLKKGYDASKDQSYFLYLLNQYQLKHALFPIGDLTKIEVRQLAKKLYLRNADKKDSTGICFIGERNFKQFLKQYLPIKPGDIKTEAGDIIGKHDGLMYYTIGQRKGLNIGGIKKFPEAAWYVINKDLKNNTLVVAQGKNHPTLFKTVLTANQIHWISEKEPKLPFECSAKIRYRQKEQKCTIKNIDDDIATVLFAKPQRAITPGQSIVFYSEDICLGGGIIVGKIK